MWRLYRKEETTCALDACFGKTAVRETRRDSCSGSEGETTTVAEETSGGNYP